MKPTSLLLVAFIVFTVAFGSTEGCAPGPTQEKAQESSPPDSGQSTDKSAADATPDAQVSPDARVSPEPSTRDTTAPEPRSTEPAPDTPPSPTSCTAIWPKLKQVYADAGALVSCDGVAAAKPIVSTLLNMRGVSIDNNGARQTPCIEAQCDDNFAYVVTNALPHYDFVQTTPNALKENEYIYRIPFKTTAIPTSTQATAAQDLKGCQSAYQQFLRNPNRGTQMEPSGQCTLNPRDTQLYVSDTVGGQKLVYHKLACFGATGFVTSGVPIFGPNEAQIPDPFGNPFVYLPDTASEPYIPQDLRGAAAMDLCFGHTAFAMHYHGINAACFERNADQTPKSSFAMATSSWDWKASLLDDCKAPSGVIGWSFDGVPIKGPCVCVKRDAGGACTSVKRARSAWVYQGLKSWGDDPKEQAALGKEATSCTKDDDCCAGAQGKCRFKCTYAVTQDAQAPGGTKVGKLCMLLDYSWCTNRYVDPSGRDVSKVNFVYMDRCNGYQGADGYAYHATSSFPLIMGCFRHQPSDALRLSGRLVQRP